MKITTDWLKEYLNYSKNLNLIDSMTSLGLEVESYKKFGKDSIIDIDITPNRPDCLSVYGIARDLSAKHDLKLGSIKKYKLNITKKSKPINKIDHKIAPVYSCLTLTNFNNKTKTPEVVARRLKACGINRVNFIVDLINFVMIEIGQPMHAFDLDKLSGQINVRNSEKGETIDCLDGKSYQLVSNTPIIADDSGPIAIAGVIGGQSTAVDFSTQSVFIESAYFIPDRIRLSSKDHRIQTDSSHRFERGVDPLLQNIALERLAYIISKETDIKDADIIASSKYKQTKKNKGKVSLSLNNIFKRLGIKIDEKFVVNVLKKLGFDPKKTKKDTLQIVIPSHRFDIFQQNDLIEEIARLFGYDKFPACLPSKIVDYDLYNKPIGDVIADNLVSRGYNEVINYTFIPRGSQTIDSKENSIISLINPITEDKAEMRVSLLYSLLKNVSYNKNRQKSSAKLFEIGRVYSFTKNKKTLEKNIIAGVITGFNFPDNLRVDKTLATFYDVKGDILSTLPNLEIERKSKESNLENNCQAYITQGVKNIGILGRVKSKLLTDYDLKGEIIYFEIDLDHADQLDSLKVSKFSIYPKVLRDITVVCDSSYVGSTLIKKIREKSHKHMINIRISDIFYNETDNSKNITLEITFQAKDRTLIDRDVSGEMTKIVSTIENELKLKIKS